MQWRRNIRMQESSGECINMRTQLNINGELKDVEIENGKITIIEPEKKATGWERVEPNEFYYRTDKSFYPDNNDTFDNQFYNRANYFSSEELAENISRMQTLQRRMFRWQAENDEPINRERETQCKYYISYEHGTNDFTVLSGQHINLGFLPCFSTREKAKECIEAFKDELTWLFTEFKWRMDG